MKRPVAPTSAAARLRPRRAAAPKRVPAPQDPDVRRLMHELQVHQVELEQQNAALQEAREQSESLLRKYSDLYDFAQVGYFSLDERGSILEANLMGAALLGLERSRLLRRNLLPFVAPASQAEVRELLKRVFAAPGRVYCEAAMAKSAGPVRWAGLHGSLESVPPGSPKRCWLAISDLTGQRRVDEQLRASETRYRRLFEAAHDGVLLLDPATRQITDANPFMTKLLGYPHAELIGKELFEIGLLKDERASQEMFRKLRRQHAVRYEDLPLKSRTGRHQEVEVVANLYQEGGRPVIQCNIRDITERKHAETVMRRNKALLSALVGQAPVGVYVVNSRFRLMQANPLACAAFRNVDPLLGSDFAEVLQAVWPPRIASQLAARFRNTLRTGEPFQSPSFIGRRRDSGLRECYEWQIERVTLPDGEHGVVCFFNDVTERNRLEIAARRVAVLAASNTKLVAEVDRRKTVERSLTLSRQEQARLLTEAREHQAQLRHLSRSVLRVQEEERRLISRELHDVVAQTLTGISLRLGGLGAQAELGPAALQRSLVATQELVAHSVETVHQFARELRPSVLDDLGLVPALHTYMKSLAARTGLRIRLTAGKEAEHLDVAHRTVLFRVAQEALTNVARHAAAENVEVVLQPEPGGFCLRITDDGRSFRVDRALHTTRGERLGLLGMRERLEMVGGRLELTSAPGVGTTVTAHVPLVAPSPNPKS